MKPRLFIPAIASGPLLWAAYFPLNLGPLAFVALAPWLLLTRAPTAGKRLYFASYLGGLAFFLPALQWVRAAHPMMYISWIGLSLVCPLFWVAALFLLRRVDQLKVPLAFSVPVVWVALEYVRAHFPTGFPFLQHVGLYQMIGFGWYFLGYTLHEVLPLIQAADLGGVYAVSFLVASVNGAVADWLLKSSRIRKWLRWEAVPPSRPVPSTVFAAALLAATAIYGWVRLHHGEWERGPRVAAIQGNVPQIAKSEKGDVLGRAYSQLHLEAAAREPKPDLIVWPETSFTLDWVSVLPGESAPEEIQKEAAETAALFAKGRWQAPVLLGLNSLEWEQGTLWKYNSALLLDPSGHPHGRYDKMHLVIFGEYVPFRETMPWMQMFTPYDHDYSCRPGEHWTRFTFPTLEGKQYTFGCLICYEDSDPYIARQYATGEPVNFLVNISNDGWFNGTEEHEEHLAICRFRAIEARRSIVRAVNMGISCVIDPDGRVVALPGESWAASKKVEGIVSANVPVDHRKSWYAALGDWLPASCWGLLVIGHIVAMIRRRRVS